MDPLCPATMCPLFARDGSPWTGEKSAPCPGHDDLDNGGCPWWGMACSGGGPHSQIAEAKTYGGVAVVGPVRPQRVGATEPRTYDCPHATECQGQIRSALGGRLCPPREALAHGLDPRTAAF